MQTLRQYVNSRYDEDAIRQSNDFQKWEDCQSYMIDVIQMMYNDKPITEDFEWCIDEICGYLNIDTPSNELKITKTNTISKVA